MKKKAEISFEDKLERIVKIAETLERGDCPLSRALELYGEASELAKDLYRELDDAKGSVLIMKKEPDGSFTEEEVTINGL